MRLSARNGADMEESQNKIKRLVAIRRSVGWRGFEATLRLPK
jgi:hypothetical protein